MIWVMKMLLSVIEFEIVTCGLDKVNIRLIIEEGGDERMFGSRKISQSWNRCESMRGCALCRLRG